MSLHVTGFLTSFLICTEDTKKEILIHVIIIQKRTEIQKYILHRQFKWIQEQKLNVFYNNHYKGIERKLCSECGLPLKRYFVYLLTIYHHKMIFYFIYVIKWDRQTPTYRRRSNIIGRTVKSVCTKVVTCPHWWAVDVISLTWTWLSFYLRSLA